MLRQTKSVAPASARVLSAIPPGSLTGLTNGRDHPVPLWLPAPVVSSAETAVVPARDAWPLPDAPDDTAIVIPVTLMVLPVAAVCELIGMWPSARVSRYPIAEGTRRYRQTAVTPLRSL